MDEPLIVKVIHRYYPDWVPPKDTGRDWHKCLCPWHGDGTASAGVSFSLDGFRCLGCGFGGSAVTIIKQIEGVSYSEAERRAEGLSEGGYVPVPCKSSRVSGRRLFGQSGVVPHERSSPEVPARIRRRTFSGPGNV